MTSTDSTLSLVPADQRELVAGMNEHRMPIPPGTVASMVARVAATRGRTVAVIAPGRTLSFRDLLDRADRVAARLLDHGVASGDRVVLSVEFGWEQVVGALAILRAGAAYVPVRPELPRAARWQRCAQVQASVVVTQSWLTERMSWADGIGVVAVDRAPAARFPGEPDRSSDQAAAQLPAAGGQFGDPISHRAIVAMADAVNRSFSVGRQDRILALAPIDSNRACYEVFGALLAGAGLVLAQDIDLHDPAVTLDLLDRHQVTILSCTPTMAGRLVSVLAERGNRLPAALRLMLLAGERLDPALVGDLRSASRPSLGVASLAAPGRSRPWAMGMAVDEVAPDWRSVPIGRPLANQRVFVLSESMRPCPVWVTGRLHFGGVAAESEEPAEENGHLIHPETGEPLRRGDQFGRVLPSGVVEVVGEVDAQIQVHGRALNLWDTEIALHRHDEVREAVVTPVGDTTDLLAHVRLSTPGGVDGPRLREYLRRKVTPYLLPARVEVVDELPLTMDGRLDRRSVAASVPEPNVPAAESGNVLTGADSAELIDEVSRIACRVLDVSDIEPHMNLMDVGATSLELVRLATVVEAELGFTVDIRELLYFPSVAVIAGHRPDAERPAEPPAAPDEPPAAPRPPGPEVGMPQPGVLTGILRRQAFKDARHGIRHEWDGAAGVELAGPAAERITRRRSVRDFSAAPVEPAALAGLLGMLREVRLDGEPKYAYPSAGGAYPIQTYVLVGPGRVRGLPEGSYYHHPVHNRLVALRPQAQLAAAAHGEVNRSAFVGSAFSLHLVSRLDAIIPLYGELSWDFSVFEAGAMTQLLMDVAPELGLGLCPVGSMDPAPLRELFRLGDSDRFVHAVLGGVPKEDPA